MSSPLAEYGGYEATLSSCATELSLGDGIGWVWFDRPTESCSVA
jgi:hypothetical protein